ncbi:MAG: hypothetical protein ACI9MC_004101, partial [Kiritimatiellia bacterium]
MRLRVTLILAVLVACSSPEGDGTDPGTDPVVDPNLAPIGFSTAPAERSFEGMVLDAGTGDPIDGAAVTIAGISASTNADGVFTVDAELGQADLLVDAAGYVPVRSKVALVSNAESFDVYMAQVDHVIEWTGDPQSLASDGAVVAIGGEAFDVGGDVSVAYLTSARLDSTGLPLVFTKWLEQRSVFGILVLDGATRDEEVSLRVPVPKGAVGIDLRLAEITDGAWDDERYPVDVSGGHATFAVPVAEPGAKFAVATNWSGMRVAQVTGSATWVYDGETHDLMPGQYLPEGAEVIIPDEGRSSHAEAVVWRAGGTKMTYGKGTRAVCRACGEKTGYKSFVSRFIGWMRSYRHTGPPRRSRFTSRRIAMGVRGTVFSARPQENGLRIEVSEGVVDLEL